MSCVEKIKTLREQGLLGTNCVKSVSSYLFVGAVVEGVAGLVVDPGVVPAGLVVDGLVPNPEGLAPPVFGGAAMPD